MTEPKKIDKLTPEQEALMPVVRDEWINLSLNSGKAIQEYEIREGVDWLYRISNLPKHPRIVIFDSFIEMQLGYNILPRLVENPVWTSIWNSVTHSNHKSVKKSVKDSVRNSLNPMCNSLLKSVKDSVHDSILNSVTNSVTNSVNRSVSFNVCDSVVFSVQRTLNFCLAFIDGFIGLANWAGWLSFYDYFNRIGIINDDENFNIFRDMIRAGIWTSCYYEHRVLVCRLPTKVSKDEQGRLHSTTGPAVQWRDGSGQYFLHGVNFWQNLDDYMSEPELWRKIVSSKDLSLKEILRIPNMEQRYAALKLYGAEKLLQEAGAQRIDKSERGNELYKIENLIRGRTLKLLKYKDRSTDRMYVSFVPYEYEKADEAMAWKFQLSEEEYRLLKVEA
jgi:hypothetical protein